MSSSFNINNLNYLTDLQHAIKMNHKNRRNASPLFSSKQRRNQHMLPRLATPMMQDMVKRCY